MQENPDVNYKNYNGDSPLLWACANGNLELVKMLINAHADVNSTNNSGATCLIYAIVNKKKDIALLLIDNGADVNVATIEEMYTPLHAACSCGDIDMVKVLIQTGAHLEAAMSNSKTPLMLACEYGHNEVVEILVGNNVDTNAMDENGNTPLIIASANGYLEIVQFLLKNKADVDIRNKDGKNASDVALGNNQFGVLEIITKFMYDQAANIKEEMEEKERAELKRAGKERTKEWLEKRLDRKVEYIMNKHTLEGDYDQKEEGEFKNTGVLQKRGNCFYVIDENGHAEMLEKLPKYCNIKDEELAWGYRTKWHVSYRYILRCI